MTLWSYGCLPPSQLRGDLDSHNAWISFRGAGHLNTAIINQFLDQFSRALAPEVHSAVIWDGAGSHRANGLKVPGNVSLILLPPYSPELNGEILWH